MIEKHLNFLKSIGKNEQGYVGNDSYKWATSVLNENDQNKIDLFLKQRFNRIDLFAYCKNKSTNDLNALLSILSWGGMRRNHGKVLLKNPEIILRFVYNLRNGIYETRQKAFDELMNARQQYLLPRLGIGYFTKLICFLSPNLNGYIMDQWAAKSINLLEGEKFIYLTGNNWVNNENNGETYERFCIRIDELAMQLKCSGFEAEEQIFSIGRGKGKWRNYLNNI